MLFLTQQKTGTVNTVRFSNACFANPEPSLLLNEFCSPLRSHNQAPHRYALIKGHGVKAALSTENQYGIWLEFWCLVRESWFNIFIQQGSSQDDLGLVTFSFILDSSLHLLGMFYFSLCFFGGRVLRFPPSSRGPDFVAVFIRDRYTCYNFCLFGTNSITKN